VNDAVGRHVVIDVRGLACPEPVLRTRAALGAAGAGVVEVVTGSPESRDNIARFAERQGCVTSWAEREPGVFVVRIVFLASERLGEGDESLGRLLTSLLLRALAERSARPAAVVLMNGGVRLALEGSECLPALAALECGGTRVMVCGTCLDYFGVKDRLRAGTVSNMYELTEILLGATRLVRA
jgi:TusA-related sulfurtransferase